MNRMNEDVKSGILKALSAARSASKIEPQTYTNIETWLSPEYNCVVEDGQHAHTWIKHWVESEDWQELDNRFFKIITPGTAGVRGRLGIGSAFINEVTVGVFAMGHALYLKEHELALKSAGRFGVVLGGDSRIGSYDSQVRGPGYLQKMVAEIYASCDIPVFVSLDPLPTPVVSFAIANFEFISGFLPAGGGITTASHNPKSDNGFKIYEPDGHQVVNEAFKREFNACLKKITSFSDVTRKSLVWPDRDQIDQFRRQSQKKTLRTIPLGEQAFIFNDEDVILKYAVNKASMSPNLNLRNAGSSEDFTFDDRVLQQIAKEKIVITALNGNAYKTTKILLELHGLKEGIHFFGVPGEIEPDGRFLVGMGSGKEGKPNPEYPEVYEASIRFARKVGASYVFASDPDSDRLGIAYLSHGEVLYFNGNQQLVLALAYLVSGEHKEMNIFSGEDVFLKTLVSSSLYEKIAASVSAKVINVHVGFKYFGQIAAYLANSLRKRLNLTPLQFSGMSWREKNNLHQKNRMARFIFGGEESMGNNVGDSVLDKDTPGAIALFCEMIGVYGLCHLNLESRLEDLYRQYGYHLEVQKTIPFSGPSGDRMKAQVMEHFRNKHFSVIASTAVAARLDYQISRKNLNANERTICDSQGNNISTEKGVPLNINHVVIPPYDIWWDGETCVPLDSSDYLAFYLCDGSSIHIRPSGTENMIKIYFNWADQSLRNENLSAQKKQADLTIQAWYDFFQYEISCLG